MWRVTPELERGIAAARARLGDRPYVLVVQTRSLDVDGYADGVTLASFDDVDAARAAMPSLAELPAWPDDPHVTLPIAIEESAGVRLVEQRLAKRKDPSGFNAETVGVQLLEVTARPVIGDALFRALRHAPELWYFLVR